ncbi:cupin domain-containing protein [Paracidobacterium acidisoli]|uniref:Cupin domain-containing protein n=1 Tax=Paracidobacterium acidisoli TaxID=2303751 RepID=A0A372IUN7_9BACT|nr:cupin domain-containing protein [Paracidobacterium acidisoli]MBT9330134.1 cupin domain-containing protein [Paracidobacterium acidisoli]
MEHSSGKKAPGNSNGSKLFKVGEAAQLLGISASMIRAWEKLGLARPLRTSSSYRLYTPADIRVLKRAVYLRKVLGLNAQAIVHQLKQEGVLSESPTSSLDSVTLGIQLRRLRKSSEQSLVQVAQELGISVGFLSNLERGHEQASIGVLRRLAQHYGVNIVDLFTSANETAIPHVKPRERKLLSGTAGVRMELLAWGKIMMEPHIFRIAPKAGSPDFYSHDGEEFIYVIAGQLTIHLQETVYQLETSDSFYFASKTPHRWINPGKTEATVLWINTPPTF